jgi:hypothetical protein
VTTFKKGAVHCPLFLCYNTLNSSVDKNNIIVIIKNDFKIQMINMKGGGEITYERGTGG